MWLSGWHTQNRGVQFPALFKAVLTNTCEPRTSYAGAGESEVQGCPWLHSEFEAFGAGGVEWKFPVLTGNAGLFLRAINTLRR